MKISTDASKSALYTRMGGRARFVFLLSMIAGAEFTIMQVFPMLGVSKYELLESVLDTAFLAILVSPIIYMFVKTEDALRKSESMFRSLAEGSQVGVYVFQAGRVVYVNPLIEEITGYSREELSGSDSPLEMLFLEEDRRTIEDSVETLLRGEAKTITRQVRCARKDGAQINLEIIGSLTERHNSPAVIGTLMDITERRLAEREREITVEFLRLVNQSVGTEDLIRVAAVFFQEQSGCTAVGVRLKEGDDYPYFEARGFPNAFVKIENSLCLRDRAGEIIRDASGNPVLECMCGNVICGRYDPSKPFFTGRGSFWTNCTTELLATTTEADRQSRTRNRCNGEGYESVALLPLHLGVNTIGLLQLNDQRKGMFSRERIALWERLADYLAVALAKFLVEDNLKKSESKYRSLFENMSSGFAYCKMIYDDGGRPVDFVYIDVNPAFGRLTGLEDVTGRRVTEAIPGIRESNPELFDIYGRVALTGLPERFEIEIKQMGKWFSISSYSTAHKYFVVVFDNVTERKQAEEKIKRDMEHLASLRFIDTTISGSLDLRITLNVLLEQTVKELHVDAACVLMFNPHSQVLEYAMGRGFNTGRIELSRVRLGEGFAGRVALERRTLAIPDVSVAFEGSAPWRLLEDESFEAYAGVPLVAKGQVKGVIEIFHRTTLKQEKDWLDFAEALAGQAAIALDSAEMFERLERTNSDLLLAYDTTIEGWSRALDFRDKETEGHSIRVTGMAVRVCKAAGMSDEELVHVRRGALLHDIGKLGVPDSILLKPGKLTDEEFEVIKGHPNIAFKLLSPVKFLRPALEIPYCHHEKWDGSGYPRGLKGEEIPLSARIFAIIDVWDALRSDRPYRPAWDVEKTREFIRSQAGSHFEARLVDVFLSMDWDGRE
ncbi:MAG: PAS domain S-box protein [Nitrospirae bacterium]|nr:PAS domain S-box protein [Nitrospirota bacterium]